MRIEPGTSQSNREGQGATREGMAAGDSDAKTTGQGRRPYDRVSVSKEARGLARQLEAHRTEGALERGDLQSQRVWRSADVYPSTQAETPEGERRIQALERQVDRLLRRLLNEQPFHD